MRINKSIKYYKVKSNIFKVIKHLDNTIDLYKMKDECKNQNCWTNEDYIWIKYFPTIIQAKQYMKGQNK
jgi:hypothetical protein